MTKEGVMDSTGRNGRKRMMVDEWSLNSSPPSTGGAKFAST